MTADFLHAIFDPYPGGRYVELREIQQGRVVQKFYQWPTDSALVSYEAEAANDHEWDVYVGALPRNSPSGKAADCPFMVRTLWADLDAKTVGSKDVAIRSAVDFPLRPNIIVDSGHGAHAWWLLRDEVEYTHARDIMKGLARELHGDNVSDAPRVLRLPGTTNWKQPEAPMPVRLIYMDLTHKYRWYDFNDLIYRPTVLPVLPERPASDTPTGLEADRVRYDPRDMPDWLAKLIVDGAPRGQRSTKAFDVVINLLRYGYDDDGIEAVFANNATGIGEKYHEKGRQGHAWLDYTIKAARRAIS